MEEEAIDRQALERSVSIKYMRGIIPRLCTCVHACSTRRGINPNPGTIYPFQEWLKTVVVEQDVVRREHRLLSQSYYILSWLSLRNDTGFWLPVSTLGSYCMACYKRASVQRSPYSLPSLLMHFGFITPRHPSGLDSSIKIQESSTI